MLQTLIIIFNKNRNPRPLGVVRVNWLCLKKTSESIGVLEYWSVGYLCMKVTDCILKVFVCQVHEPVCVLRTDRQARQLRFFNDSITPKKR